MSFENLTPTWTDNPLTDPDVTADVVDLMVTPGDRRTGTLTAVICDPGDRYLATVMIDLPEDYGRRDPADLFRTGLDPIFEAVRTVTGAAVILALGRPSVAELDDRAWAAAAHQVCAAVGVRLLRFYVATKEGVREPAAGALT
jgi:hypothetical protein